MGLEKEPVKTTVLLDRAIPLPSGSGVRVEPKASALSPYTPKPTAEKTVGEKEEKEENK